MPKLRRVTAEQFKKAVSEKHDLHGLVAVKGVPAVIEREAGDDDQRVLTFTISSGDVDRDGDTLDPNGWELDNFIKGGSMLWGHNPDKVIAKPLATWLESGKLKSRAKFPSKEESEFAYSMYQLFLGGYVRGTSVGFIPKEWKENSERGGWSPIDFLKQELLEYSGTPVPSNPHALMDAKSKGIDLDPLAKLVVPVLDGDSEAGLFIPKSLAEEIYSSANDGKVYSIPTPNEKHAEGLLVGGGCDAGGGLSPVGLPPPSTASDILERMAEQIGKACDMIASRSEELAKDIEKLVSIIGNQQKALGDDSRKALANAHEALWKLLGDTVESDIAQADDADSDQFIELDLEVSETHDGFEIDEAAVSDALRDFVAEQVDASLRQAMGRVD